MPPVNLRAGTACKIVGLDPLKLNEAISRGIYRCAPPTTPGSVRRFTEPAMMPLYFLARLLDCNIPMTWAGPVACDMADHVAEREAGGVIDDIVMLIGERAPIAFGGGHPQLVEWVPARDYDPELGRRGGYGDIGRVVLVVRFEVKTIRAIIAELIQHELNEFLTGKSDSLL